MAQIAAPQRRVQAEAVTAGRDRHCPGSTWSAPQETSCGRERDRNPPGAPMELICEPCRALLDAGDGIDTRPCWLCTVTVGCRHEMRKGRVRIEGGEWSEQVVCKDAFACMSRFAARIIR